MLSVDQIKLLESKVSKAVDLINELYTERISLKEQIEVKNKRISELENLIAAFKDDQSRIEQGIINALKQLSTFEKTVSEKISAANLENNKPDLTADNDSVLYSSASQENVSADVTDNNKDENLSLQNQPESGESSDVNREDSSVEENQLDIF